jgi:nucleoid DNA-binding protein
MKISKKDLVKQLSEQLGSDEEAVSSQFDKMLADVQKALSKGEAYSINGFGTFTVTDNEITFEIAPSFAAEINYTYEGMLPIDVDGTAAFTQDNEKAKPAKPSRRTPVVIVDEGVEGEEDPFGISEPQVDESEFIDPIEFLNDLEGHDDESISDAVEGTFTNKIDQLDEDYVPMDGSHVVPQPIDDSIDEEELQLLESIGGTNAQNKDSNQSDELDPFGIPDSEEESTSILETSESINEEPIETDSDSEQLEHQENEETYSEPADPSVSVNEGLSSDSTSDDVKPPIIVHDHSGKTETVLDAFFVEEPSMELEGVLHDSDQDIDRLISDGVDPQQNAHGPRIVSIEEDAKDYSISIGTIFKWVAILVMVVLIAGGGYWYFTGPGQNFFRSSQPLAVQSSQPVVIPSDEAVVSVDVPKTDDHLSENTVNQLTEGVSEDKSIVSNQTESAATENSTIGAVSRQNDPAGTNVNPDPEPAATTSVNLPTQSGSITTQNASYGLNGVEQTLSGRVFSIIVHSLPGQISAQEQCNEISALNLRCLVREATGPQGRTTYRVGIGQFESLQVAESAVSQLPEPYRSRNFVARVN